jgi:hypothetical protein
VTPTLAEGEHYQRGQFEVILDLEDEAATAEKQSAFEAK